MPYVDDYGRVIDDGQPQPVRAPPLSPQQQAAQAQQLFALQRAYPPPAADPSTLSGYVNRPNAIAPRQATLNDRQTMDPVNPVDRARNWVTDSDWYRGLNRDAQGVITGGLNAADLAASPLRAAYDAGKGLAKGEYGSAALDAASALPLGKAAALAKVAGAGKLAVFAGVTAKTADRETYNLANKMAREGASPGDIHAATGWSQGPEGKWRFEIPDQPSRYVAPKTPDRLQLAEQIHRDELGGSKTAFTGQEPDLDKQALRLADQRIAEGATSTRLGDVLHHPELYAAYPDLAEIPTSRGSDPRLRGSYYPPDMGEEISYGGGRINEPGGERSTLLHETQHAIQEREGFARGGNPSSFGKDAFQLLKERRAAITTPISQEDFIRDVYQGDVAAGTAAYPGYVKETQNALKGPMGPALDRAAQETAQQHAYRRQAGEVEARNVQYRMDIRPEELRDLPPTYTQDVPTAQQFVNLRKSYDEPAASAAQQVRAATLRAAARRGR